MDTSRILELAHDSARDHWFDCDQRLKAMPDNRIRKEREAEAWRELMELEQIISAWKETQK